MLLKQWEKLAPYPGGKRIFSYLFGRMVPYSGSIHPEIVHLEAGHVKVLLRDRRKVRNHLQSIHAAALMNLAEAASGLSFVTGLPKDARAIVLEFKIKYFKKARGNLIAECYCAPPSTVTERKEYKVQAQVKNENGETVCEAEATWLVSPPENK